MTKRFVVTEKKLTAAKQWMARSEYARFVLLLRLVSDNTKGKKGKR